MKIFKNKQKNKEQTHSTLLFIFIASTLIALLMLFSFSRSFIDYCIEVSDEIDVAIEDRMFVDGQKPNTLFERIEFYKELNNPTGWDYSKYKDEFFPKIKEASENQTVYQADSVMFVGFRNGQVRVFTEIEVDGNAAHGTCKLTFTYEDIDKDDIIAEMEFYRILQNDMIKTYVKTQNGWIVSDGHVLYEDNVYIDLQTLMDHCLAGEISFFPFEYSAKQDQFSIPVHPGNTMGITQGGKEFYATCPNNTELLLLFNENTFLPTMVGLPSHTFYMDKNVMHNNFDHLNDTVFDKALELNVYAPWITHYFEYEDIRVTIPDELNNAREVNNLIEAIPEEMLKEIFSHVE